jgi:hypothetical protein
MSASNETYKINHDESDASESDASINTQCLLLDHIPNFPQRKNSKYRTNIALRKHRARKAIEAKRHEHNTEWSKIIGRKVYNPQNYIYNQEDRDTLGLDLPEEIILQLEKDKENSLPPPEITQLNEKTYKDEDDSIVEFDIFDTTEQINEKYKQKENRDNFRTINLFISREENWFHFKFDKKWTFFTDIPNMSDLKKLKISEEEYIIWLAIIGTKNKVITTNIKKTKLSRHFSKFLKRNKIQIRFNPEMVEEIPDKPRYDNDCWKFNPTLLESLIKLYDLPRPTFDCFASCINKMCESYCSKNQDLISPYWDFLKNIDKLIIDANNVFWANPPFITEIVQTLLDIFKKHKLTGYIITPLKLRDNNLNKLIRDAADITLTLDKHTHIFYPSSTNYERSVGPTPWKTQICMFNIDNAPQKKDEIRRDINFKKAKAARRCKKALESMTNNDIICFTDGSALMNPGHAGAACPNQIPRRK